VLRAVPHSTTKSRLNNQGERCTTSRRRANLGFLVIGRNGAVLPILCERLNGLLPPTPGSSYVPPPSTCNPGGMIDDEVIAFMKKRRYYINTPYQAR
jgi:hypothetical protein